MFVLVQLFIIIAYVCGVYGEGFQNIIADGRTVYCWVEGDPFDHGAARQNVGDECKVASMALQKPIGENALTASADAEVSWFITMRPDNDIIALYNNTVILGLHPAGSITESGRGIVSVFQGYDYNPFNSSGKARALGVPYTSVGTSFSSTIQIQAPGEYVVMTQAQYYYNSHMQLNFAIFTRVTVAPVYIADGKTVYCWNRGDPFDDIHVVSSGSGADCKVDEMTASIAQGSSVEMQKFLTINWKIKLNAQNDIIKVFNNTMVDGMDANGPIVVGPITGHGLGYLDNYHFGSPFNPYNTSAKTSSAGVAYTSVGAAFNQSITFDEPGDYVIMAQTRFYYNRHIEFNFAIFTKVVVTGKRC